jgi:hypothetical protein
MKLGRAGWTIKLLIIGQRTVMYAVTRLTVYCVFLFLAWCLVVDVRLPKIPSKSKSPAGHVVGLENIAKTGSEEPLSPETRMSKNTTTVLKSR